MSEAHVRGRVSQWTSNKIWYSVARMFRKRQSLEKKWKQDVDLYAPFGAAK